MRRTTYKHITYKLCHFGTVHCTYRYCTYGWLVTRNLCRELHIIQYILVDRLLSYDATYVASWLSKPLHSSESQDTRWGHAADYQNITYKLCHFGTVHCTYRYCTYGWLVTRNLCRELHIIQYILVDHLLSYDATPRKYTFFIYKKKCMIQTYRLP